LGWRGTDGDEVADLNRNGRPGEAVRDALRPIMDLLADVEGEPQEPSDEGQDRRRRGYRERRDELIEAQNTLAAAMRTDVTSIHD
jgi:hypothetical protein